MNKIGTQKNERSILRMGHLLMQRSMQFLGEKG